MAVARRQSDPAPPPRSRIVPVLWTARQLSARKQEGGSARNGADK